MLTVRRRQCGPLANCIGNLIEGIVSERFNDQAKQDCTLGLFMRYRDLVHPLVHRLRFRIVSPGVLRHFGSVAIAFTRQRPQIRILYRPFFRTLLVQ